MAQSFERVEQAVNDKVNHLKDVAKLGDLAKKLGDEFTTAKTKLQENKDAIPKILKGFDEVQIHQITKNAEVKEEEAKQKLSADVDKLIAMLKSSPVSDTTEKNMQGRETSPNTQPTQSPTTVETVTKAANISPELNKEIDKTLIEVRTILNNFDPQNKQEALTQFPLIEQKLTDLIAHAGKIEAALPAGNDKEEMGKIKQELTGYKAELIKNKSVLEGLPDGMFGMAKGKLDEAKAQARQLIARFEGVVTRNNTPSTTTQETNTQSNTTNATTEATATAPTSTEAVVEAPAGVVEQLKTILAGTPISRYDEVGKLPADLYKQVSQAKPGQMLTGVGTFYSDVGDPAREFSLQDIDPKKSNNYQIFEGGRRFIRRFPEGTSSTIYSITKEQFDAIQTAINSGDKGEAIRAELAKQLNAATDKTVNFAVNTYGVERDKFALTVRVQPSK